MNPYDHDKIENFLDIRLVDCFIKQNQDNEWLSPAPVASWVFQTNSPSAYQRDYVLKKMFSILGVMWTREVELSFLEKASVTENGKRLYVFRLNDASLIQPKDQIASTVEHQLDQALSGPTSVDHPLPQQSVGDT